MQLGSIFSRGAGIALALCAVSIAVAQPPDFGGRGFGPGGFGGGFGGPGGRGFPGGPGGPGQRIKLLEKFDKDGKGYLNAAERKAAREYLAARPRRGPGGRGGRGFGPPGFGGGASSVVPTAGPKLKPEDVKRHGKESLYDPLVLRTFFLEFEDADWEKELEDFYHTDVDVPAKLTVDGKVYPDVGVHFRGMSSYSAVAEGHKRSLDVSMNFVHDEQRLGGYRSLNLLNSNADPTFLRTVLYH